MGSSHSKTNLGREYVKCTEDAAEACLDDSIRVEMSKSGDGSDKVVHWDMAYKIGLGGCFFCLKNHKNSVELNLQDSTDNTSQLQVKIERDGFGGLPCKVDSCFSLGEQFSSLKDYQDCSVETTIISYRCSKREGLLVVEKKLNANKNPYMVTLAHYYVHKDLGLSAVARVRGVSVEVEGPYKHPANDLRKVLDQTCRSRVWTPTACPHCCTTPQHQPSRGVSNFSRKFLKYVSSNQSSNTEVGSMMIYPSSGNSGVQSYGALIHNSGDVSGMFNGSMFYIFGDLSINDKED
ncbi:hypothetical protein L6164_036868 [Bauhinia variegata]|uniref:Uncharacterized protein n=1 Tax=Bauhinia variegata TaxID=167791 RepID=A0ACB9KJ46_BAUVA|nr:hypothetical protein L6164_036868 [Bauhinia variegata]